MPNDIPIIETGEYKGNKTITFKKNAEDRFPFSFGLTKAKIILANIKAIQKFVDDNADEQ